MAAYNSLSDSDKAVVQNTVNLIRGASAEMAAIWNRLKGIADDTNATELVASIDALDTIPNTSGLAGADDMTRTEVVTLWMLLNSIRTTNDTTGNRASMSKAAGVNAILHG